MSLTINPTIPPSMTTTTTSDAGGGGEILVLPFFGQGHLFPCIELTKHLSSRNFTVTLIVSSSLSASLPSSVTHIHLIHSDPIGTPPSGPNLLGPGPGTDPFGKQQDKMGAGIEEMLKSRPDGTARPVYAVVDVMMSWSKEVFRKHEMEGAAGILMNTCHEFEGSFLDYVAEEIGKPVWGVGPLLPDEYWRSVGSVLHDRGIRPRKESSHTEDQVGRWLDSKLGGSVLYVSFGSEVGATRDEYGELEKALEESDCPFIWLIQLNSGRPGPPGGGVPPGSEHEDGFYPYRLAGKVKQRGLIIHGWAPQLLILSHPSTGGFLSHCGWNSTVEGIGRGVPFLAWPIRGDQFYNAKLVVSHL